MNKISILLVALLVSFVLAGSLSQNKAEKLNCSILRQDTPLDGSDIDQFINHKKQHNLLFGIEEEVERFKNFQANLLEVKNHNENLYAKCLSSFFMKLNHLSHLHLDEKIKTLAKQIPSSQQEQQNTRNERVLQSSSVVIPSDAVITSTNSSNYSPVQNKSAVSISYLPFKQTNTSAWTITTLTEVNTTTIKSSSFLLAGKSSQTTSYSQVPNYLVSTDVSESNVRQTYQHSFTKVQVNQVNSSVSKTRISTIITTTITTVTSYVDYIDTQIGDSYTLTNQVSKNNNQKISNRNYGVQNDTTLNQTSTYDVTLSVSYSPSDSSSSSQSDQLLDNVSLSNFNQVISASSIKSTFNYTASYSYSKYIQTPYFYVQADYQVQNLSSYSNVITAVIGKLYQSNLATQFNIEGTSVVQYVGYGAISYQANITTFGVNSTVSQNSQSINGIDEQIVISAADPVSTSLPQKENGAYSLNFAQQATITITNTTYTIGSVSINYIINQNALVQDITVSDIKQNSNIPDYWNWVSKGAVSAVRNSNPKGQKNSITGAAYYQPEVAALESLRYFQQKNLQKLSVSFVNDCLSSLNSSNSYQVAGYGIPLDVNYNGNKNCVLSWPSTAYFTRFYSLTSYFVLDQSNSSFLLNVLSQQPVVVSLSVGSSFFSYGGGILDSFGGDGTLNYQALAVGFNQSESSLIVQNNWGTSWGESGYFRLNYANSDSDIYKHTTWPIPAY